MAHEKSDKQIDLENVFGRPLEWMSGLAVGVTSASITFYNLVRTKFHNDSSGKEFLGTIVKHKGNLLSDVTSEQVKAALRVYEPHFKNEPTFQTLKGVFKELEYKGVPNRLGNQHPNVKKFTEAFIAFEEACGTKVDQIRLAPEFKKARDAYIKTTRGNKIANDHTFDRFAEMFLGIESLGVKGKLSGSLQRVLSFGKYSDVSILFKTLAAFGGGFGVTMMVWNQLNSRNKMNSLDKSSGETNEQLDKLSAKMDALLQTTATPSPVNDNDAPKRQARATTRTQAQAQARAMANKQASFKDAVMAERAESLEPAELGR